MHVLLKNGGVAAAEFGWVAGAQPAVLEHHPLPSPRPVGDVTAGMGSSQGLFVARQMFVQECHELRAESLDVSVEIQLHGAPGKEKLKTSVISKMRILFS